MVNIEEFKGTVAVILTDLLLNLTNFLPVFYASLFYWETAIESYHLIGRKPGYLK